MRLGRAVLVLGLITIAADAWAVRKMSAPRYSRRSSVSWTGLPVGSPIGVLQTFHLSLDNLSAVQQSVKVRVRRGSAIYGVHGVPGARPNFDRCLFYTGGPSKNLGNSGVELSSSDELEHSITVASGSVSTLVIGVLFHSTFRNAVGTTDAVTAIFAPSVGIEVSEDRGAVTAVLTPHFEGVVSGTYPCVGNVSPFYGPTSIQSVGSDVPMLLNGGRPF
jgi:hypothetical protein